MARNSKKTPVNPLKPFRHYSKTVSKRTGRCPILSAFPRLVLHDEFDALLLKYQGDDAGLRAALTDARDFLAPITTSTIAYNHDVFKLAWLDATGGPAPLAKTAWLQGVFFSYWVGTGRTSQLSVKDIEALIVNGFEPCPDHLRDSFKVVRTHDAYLAELAEAEAEAETATV